MKKKWKKYRLWGTKREIVQKIQILEKYILVKKNIGKKSGKNILVVEKKIMKNIYIQ